MPIYEVGDMWSIFDSTDHFLITTNCHCRGDGALVMGRGIAAEAKRRFPNLPHLLGDAIRNGAGNKYLILQSPDSPLAAFQVKFHWADDAQPGLIEQSAHLLSAWATNRPEERFDLNFPGIGNGRLKIEDVLPRLDIADLPSNVHIWTKHPLPPH